MKQNKKYLATLCALVMGFANQSFAQSSQFKLDPRGVSGSAGVGVALFNIKTPANNFLIEDGLYGNLSIEKGLGFLGFYITLSLSYLKTKGQTNYQYATLNGNTYQGSNVAYDSDIFHGGLGLRWKLLPGFFRPYVEAGGTGGYYMMKYDKSPITGPDNAFKANDGLLDFGYYGEGGLEINFSPQFGVRLAARYTESKTKPFKTLGEQRINYTSETYYLSVLRNF